MDDEEMVRTVASAMLTQLGHEVVLSENGAEAIKYYQKAYSLVFDDETLDEEGRESLIENIKSQLKELGVEISA